MKFNKKATSIVEAMVVLLIVMIAVTWAYDMYSKSVRVTDSSGFRLQAISMAKEWIEAMTNIRDTNWMVLPWDYPNCWNTFDYDPRCLNEDSSTYDIPHNRSFIIYKDIDYRWKLNDIWNIWSVWEYSSWWYRTTFEVGTDSDWFYTQSWIVNQLKPIFTREIQITYLDDSIAPLEANLSDEQKMQVTSLVQWKDPSSENVKKVELTTILTNWRNKVY